MKKTSAFGVVAILLPLSAMLLAGCAVGTDGESVDETSERVTRAPSQNVRAPAESAGADAGAACTTAQCAELSKEKAVVNDDQVENGTAQPQPQPWKAAIDPLGGK